MTHHRRVFSPACWFFVAGLTLSIVTSSISAYTVLAQVPAEPPTSTPPPPPSDTPSPTIIATTPNDTPLPTASDTSTPTPTESSTPTASDSPTPTASSTLLPSPTSTSTSTASATGSTTGTAAASPSSTSTPSSTASATAVDPPPAYPPGTILINEIAWSGTQASAFDEWIELLNTSGQAINLSGWTLSDGSDINISLNGTISAHGFFLLERSDDHTVSNINADQIYTGGLRNNGENLRLRDPAGNRIDSANYPGGWPAGDSSPRMSMERRGGEDVPGNWGTYSGSGGWGRDAGANPIYGTPRQTNSFFLPTATATPTATTNPTTMSTPIPAQSVFINEIAWSGTFASSSDEWIELHNPGPEPIDLHGWTLSDGGDIHIVLTGEISAFGFYLLERTDDSCVSDVRAQQIYTGNLSNGGERLFLRDSAGRVIDSANGDGGGWPAGSNRAHSSMERRGGTDRSGNWGTFTGYYGSGRDADGLPIAGTPGTTNSLFFPTPVPTWIPGKVVINEVLIRPHYDWEGKEGPGLDDEFIELYNIGPQGVDLGGFMLDDVADGGSKPYTLPDVRIPAGGFVVFFRSQTRIALNDTGDEVRLLSPSGRQLDAISYLKVRAYNLSYGRLPDGSGHLYYGLWPTPGDANLLFIEELEEEETNPVLDQDYVYTMRLVRLSRFPALVQRMALLGHVFQVPKNPSFYLIFFIHPMQ